MTGTDKITQPRKTMRANNRKGNDERMERPDQEVSEHKEPISRQHGREPRGFRLE
jgi:hypothetical protein